MNFQIEGSNRKQAWSIQFIPSKLNYRYVRKVELSNTVSDLRIIIFVDTDASKRFKVKCQDIDSFPNLVMTLGEKTLTLEPSYYTMKHGQHCYSRLKPMDIQHWLIGDAFLSKFYTEFDATKDHEKITFFVAK